MGAKLSARDGKTNKLLPCLQRPKFQEGDGYYLEIQGEPYLSRGTDGALANTRWNDIFIQGEFRDHFSRNRTPQQKLRSGVKKLKYKISTSLPDFLQC